MIRQVFFLVDYCLFYFVVIRVLFQVQESFELNHETLYTAVKMTDIYLSKKQVTHDHDQTWNSCFTAAFSGEERGSAVGRSYSLSHRLQGRRHRHYRHSQHTVTVTVQVDERIPPMVDDFLYVCDDAYSRDQLMRMERKMLSVVGFDLSYSLTYR